MWELTCQGAKLLYVCVALQLQSHMHEIPQKCSQRDQLRQTAGPCSSLFPPVIHALLLLLISCLRCCGWLLGKAWPFCFLSGLRRKLQKQRSRGAACRYFCTPVPVPGSSSHRDSPVLRAKSMEKRCVSPRFSRESASVPVNGVRAVVTKLPATAASMLGGRMQSYQLTRSGLWILPYVRIRLLFLIKKKKKGHMNFSFNP